MEIGGTSRRCQLSLTPSALDAGLDGGSMRKSVSYKSLRGISTDNHDEFTDRVTVLNGCASDTQLPECDSGSVININNNLVKNHRNSNGDCSAENGKRVRSPTFAPCDGLDDPMESRMRFDRELIQVEENDEDNENADSLSDSQDFSAFVPLAFGFLPQHLPPRSWCLAIVTNRWFERLSMLLILVNCVTLGMYRPCEDHPVCNSSRCVTLAVFDHAIFCFFTLEMLIKVIAMGLYGRKSYLDSPWNRLDAAIIISGLLEYCVSSQRDINLTAIRGVRVLRPLRAINRIPSLRILVTLLLDTLPMLGNVLLLCFFVFFIFGIMGVQLWQSVLRNRCMMNDSINALAKYEFGVVLPTLFQPVFPEKEFICSRSLDDGMRHCSDIPAFVESPRRKCNLTIEQCRSNAGACTNYFNYNYFNNFTSGYNNSLLFFFNSLNASYDSNSSGCINWNQYYDTCTIGDKNPFLGAVSFDNIGFAWIAIFQVISLEAWVDVLYAIQDASSYWSFIYFVALIVVGSFFMINLCLVVIATQFSDTKKRETERIRQERMLALSSSSITIFSESHGLYRELVKLIVHIIRKVRRNIKRAYRDYKQRRGHLDERTESLFANQSSEAVIRRRASSGNEARHHDYRSVSPSRREVRSGSTASIYSTSCACAVVPPGSTRGMQRPGENNVQRQSDAQTRGYEKANIEIRITNSESTGEEELQVRMNHTDEQPQCEKSTEEDGSKIQLNDATEFIASSKDLDPIAPKADPDPESDGDQLTAPARQSELVRYHLYVGRHSNTSSYLQKSGVGSVCSCSLTEQASGRVSSTSFCRQSCQSCCSTDECSRNDQGLNGHVAPVRRTSSCSRCTQRSKHNQHHRRRRHQSRSSSRRGPRLHRQSTLSSKKSQNNVVRLWKRLRLQVKSLITHRYAQRAILCCIMLNTFSMGIEHHRQPQLLTDILEYSNLLFTSLFAIEMLLKLIAYGILGYISNIFNVWDSIIVILSVVELSHGGASGLSVLRTFRLLRILKLVRFMPALRRQLVVMLRTMDNVTTFLLLLSLFMFIFSVLGMNLFGCKFCEIDRSGSRKCFRNNFDSLLWASITVFQVLTQEDWNAVLYLGMSRTSAWASLYFVALMTFGNYVLFNLLVAILVEGFATDDRVSVANLPVGCDCDCALSSSPAKSSAMRKISDRSCATRSTLSERSCASQQNGHAHRCGAKRQRRDQRHRNRNGQNHDRDRCKRSVTRSQPSRDEREYERDHSIVLPVITTTQATPVAQHTHKQMQQANTTILVTSADENQCVSGSYLELLQSHSLKPSFPFDPDTVSLQSIDRSIYSLNKTEMNEMNGEYVCAQMGRRSFPAGNKIQRDKDLPRTESNVRLRSGSLRETESEMVKNVADRLIDSNHLHPQMCLHASFRVKRSPGPCRIPARRFASHIQPSVKSSIVDEDNAPSRPDLSDSIISYPLDLPGADRRSRSSIESSVHSVFELNTNSNTNTNANTVPNAKEQAEYNREGAIDECDEESGGRCSSESEQETSDEELSDEDLARKVHNDVERAIQEQEEIENNLAAVGEIAFDMRKFVPTPRGCFLTRREYSLYIFKPDNILRVWCKKLVEARRFESAVLAIIVLNCVALALEKPFHKEHSQRDVLDIANYLFTVIFAIEMIVKIIANNFIIGEKAYMTSGWNRMDSILVLVSLVDFVASIFSVTSGHRIFQMLRVFRLLRTLRPLRVINRAPGLKLVVQTLLSSLRPIGNIVLICCAFFVIFGILGVQLFKGKFYYCDGSSLANITSRSDCERAGMKWVNHKYNFDNLGQALMTLFVLASKDGWVQIMYQGLDAVGEDLQPIENYNEWRLIYFVSFLLIVGFFVISMFVGVIVDNFNRARHMQMTEEKTRRLQKRIQKLRLRLEQSWLPPYWISYPSWRLRMHKLTRNKYFDLAVSAIIGINVITMALEFYLMPPALKLTLELLNYCFTCLFIIEAVFKIVAIGFLRYIRDRWNQLDLVIIVLSVVGIVLEDVGYDVFRVNPTLIRVFRVLRIARVLKLLKMAKGIRELLDTVVLALPQVGNLGLLFFLLFYIFAALGVELFGSLECSEDRPCVGMSEHANFQTFPNAFLTLFRIATGDNWSGILKDTLRDDCNTDPDCHKNCCVSTIAAPLFFVVFVLIAQFVLVNVVIAVLMRHLEDAHRSIDDEDLMDDTDLDAELRADLRDVLNDLQRMNIGMRRRKSCIFPALPRIIAPPLGKKLKQKVKGESQEELSS